MERPFRPYEGSDAFVFVCYAHDDDEVVYSDRRKLQPANPVIDRVLRGRQSFGKSPANAEAIALFEQAVEP